MAVAELADQRTKRFATEESTLDSLPALKHPLVWLGCVATQGTSDFSPDIYMKAWESTFSGARAQHLARCVPFSGSADTMTFIWRSRDTHAGLERDEEAFALFAPKRAGQLRFRLAGRSNEAQPVSSSLRFHEPDIEQEAVVLFEPVRRSKVSIRFRDSSEDPRG